MDETKKIKLCAEVVEIVKGLTGDFESYYTKPLYNITEKSFNNSLTEADVFIQDKVISALKHLLPLSGIIAEEHDLYNRAEFTWVIDPIDGTSNFVNRIPFFSISIGLLHYDDPIIGVVYNPITKDLFHAVKEGGAYLNNEKIYVSANRHIEKSIIGTGIPYDDFTKLDEYLKVLRECILQCHSIRRAGCASLELAYVASGKYDVFFENNLNIWDVCAGVLLVQEAGGTISDFQGGNDFVVNKQIIAGNFVKQKVLNIISGSEI